MLAHNSVDRDLMARDSIELTQYDVVSTPRARTRSANSELRLGAPSTSRIPADTDADEDRPRKTRTRAGVRNEDDSELLIHPEDMNLDEVDGEEAQFLRTNKRVAVRRSAIPKKTANKLMIAGWIAGAVVVAAGFWALAYDYSQHSWRFRIESSDSVEISGVHNASRVQVMKVAGQDVGRNIFFVPLDERKRQLEEIPWVEHASVMRLLPNRLSVTIEERTPVAFVQLGSHVSLIDANGVVMGMPDTRQTKYSFPVIRGITETEALSSRAAAMKIYNRLIGELNTTDATGKSVDYVRQLSEVDLSDPEDVKVTANDPGGTTVVHLGAQDFLSRYKLYTAHIAEWRQQSQNLQSVDLRYEGQVVVNPDKERVSEKPSPLINADNADQKKPTVKPVAFKPAAKAPVTKPAAQKAAPQKPVVKKVAAKPAVKAAVKKPVAKAASKKPVQKKTTQTAQR